MFKKIKKKTKRRGQNNNEKDEMAGKEAHHRGRDHRGDGRRHRGDEAAGRAEVSKAS